MKTKIIVIALLGLAFYQFYYKPSYMVPEVSARNINPDCDAVVFTTQRCPYCAKARKLLTRQKVKWCEYDIEKTAEYYWLHKELGGRGVPLAVIGSRTLHGFNENTYMEAIFDIYDPNLH